MPEILQEKRLQAGLAGEIGRCKNTVGSPIRPSAETPIRFCWLWLEAHSYA
jgi:hypothetical protein